MKQYQIRLYYSRGTQSTHINLFEINGNERQYIEGELTPQAETDKQIALYKAIYNVVSVCQDADTF